MLKYSSLDHARWLNSQTFTRDLVFSAVEHVQVGEVVETNQIHLSHCQHLQQRTPEQERGTG